MILILLLFYFKRKTLHFGEIIIIKYVVWYNNIIIIWKTPTFEVVGMWDGNVWKFEHLCSIGGIRPWVYLRVTSRQYQCL